MASIINAASSGSGGLVSTADSSGVLQLQTNGTTAMTVATSGYVGIGTSSPNSALDVVGNARFENSSGDYLALLPTSRGSNSFLGNQAPPTGGSIFSLTPLGAGVATSLVFGTYSASPLYITTNNTVQATLDSSGNLGLGTTSPTAFGTGYTSLTISGSNAGIFQSKNSSGDTRLYADTSGNALIGSWANTSLKFYTNSSLQMTLNNSGRLLIGGTTDYATGLVQIRQSADGYGYATIDSGGNFTAYLRADAAGARVGNNSSYALIFDTNSTERARIDSSGNLYVGTTSGNLNSVTPKMGLRTSGTTGTGIALYSLQNTANAYVAIGSQYDTTNTNNGSQVRFGIDALGDTYSMLSFATAYAGTPTERARIDASGRFGIGYASPNAQLVVQGAGGSGWVNNARNTLQLRNSNASGNQSCFINFASAANDSYCFIGNDLAANGTQVNQLNVQAGSSGGVYLASGGTSWSSSSDARLKNITGTYTDALTDIAQLQPVKFTWKADANNTPQVGVIAQSVQPVVPEAVTQGQMSSEDKTEYLSVRYTELIPLMIASIQQLKAEFDAYKASHP